MRLNVDSKRLPIFVVTVVALAALIVSTVALTSQPTPAPGGTIHAGQHYGSGATVTTTTPIVAKSGTLCAQSSETVNIPLGSSSYSFQGVPAGGVVGGDITYQTGVPIQAVDYVNTSYPTVTINNTSGKVKEGFFSIFYYC